MSAQDLKEMGIKFSQNSKNKEVRELASAFLYLFDLNVLVTKHIAINGTLGEKEYRKYMDQAEIFLSNHLNQGEH